MRPKLLFSAVAAAAMSAVAASNLVPPINNMAATQPERDPVEPDPRLVAEFQACSDIAEAHVISPSFARQCADSYFALKLSFLPNVDPINYWELSVEQRWAAQKLGYAAFRRWKEEGARLSRYNQSAGKDDQLSL